MADRFIPFQESIEGLEIPKEFTFPFYYQPNPLAINAAIQLKEYLTNQTDWIHNFGLDPEDKTLAIGKMFGVLVVQNANLELGFLAGFSGKLADSNEHQFFVPPVYDMLRSDGFFKNGEKIINKINQEIETLEANEEYISLKSEWLQLSKKAQLEIEGKKEEVNNARRLRKQKKKELQPVLSSEDYDELLAKQVDESLRNKYFFNLFVKEWDEKLQGLKRNLIVFEDQLEKLKMERKERSNALQQQLFDNYKFLNAEKEWKSLREIFSLDLNIPIPAGSGECAAPKLLHYAFLHELKPIAMAEFWWGQSPKSEIRKHGEFYPACKSKCEPILGHMLKGLEVEENPFLKNPAEGKELEVIFEDDVLMVVNKPSEFLSVPGKNEEMQLQLVRSSGGTPFVSYIFKLNAIN